MFKRLSNKVLLPVFLLLLVVFLVLEYGGFGKVKPTIPSNLGQVDTSKVKALRVYKNGPSPLFELVKKKGEWKVKKDGKTYNAQGTSIERSLVDLSGLTPERLVTSDTAKWDQYRVGKNSRRIEVRGSEGTLLDLMVGKMSVSKQKGKGARAMMRRRRRPNIKFHVRPVEQKNVYKVKGRAMMRFRRGYQGWVDHSIIDGPQENWKELKLSSGDSSLTLKKKKDSWRSTGASMDSSAIQSYMNALAELEGRTFTPSAKAGSLKNVALQLQIKRQQKGAIRVKAYPAVKDTTTSYYIKSSMNPGLIFKDRDSSLYKKMIPGGTEEKAPSPKRRRALRQRTP
ncbi:MAG: DUF4340 domain-containing protein [Flavobacteriales bacterium]